MNYPYMPKSTALWLIENTSLTFEQIAEFCGLHELEVKNIADAETQKMQGLNPILNGQLTREDIANCEADPNARLTLRESIVRAQNAQNKKGVGYTPKLHRQNRLGGILWILKIVRNCLMAKLHALCAVRIRRSHLFATKPIKITVKFKFKAR